MRPTIRLASLMKLPVKYVFTHDSIGVGEDGPTHQPVEQLASLRAIPGLVVIRPADANETAEAWRIAVESRDNPVAVICTRQKLPVLDRELLESAAGVRRGAYILKDPPGGQPDVILIASGSEIILALRAQEALLHRNINARVVSMPSWELFDRQSKEYRESVLPDEIDVRLAIEAGSPVGWHKYTGSDGDVIGVEHFGASAPGPKIMEEYGFNTDNICSRVMALLGRRERVQ
jgi:transketolase